MEQQNNEIEKRSHPRITRHFIVQFQAQERENAFWAASAVKDISEKGCFFYTDASYNVGEKLEVKILFPALREHMRFTAQVQRCEPAENRRDVYGVGVSFVWAEEGKQKAFLDTLDYFLKKQPDDERT